MAISIVLTPEHGYAIAVMTLLWFQQQFIFVLPIALARKKYGIEPPTLYPRDSEIKALSLTSEQVDDYMCKQRVHQNNVEFLSAFFPLMMISSILFPMDSAKAGAVVVAGRMVTAIGYWKGAQKRTWGAWFHFGEYLIWYLAAKSAYLLIKS